MTHRSCDTRVWLYAVCVLSQCTWFRSGKIIQLICWKDIRWFSLPFLFTREKVLFHHVYWAFTRTSIWTRIVLLFAVFLLLCEDILPNPWPIRRHFPFYVIPLLVISNVLSVPSVKCGLMLHALMSLLMSMPPYQIVHHWFGTALAALLIYTSFHLLSVIIQLQHSWWSQWYPSSSFSILASVVLVF